MTETTSTSVSDMMWGVIVVGYCKNFEFSVSKFSRGLVGIGKLIVHVQRALVAVVVARIVSCRVVEWDLFLVNSGVCGLGMCLAADCDCTLIWQALI